MMLPSILSMPIDPPGGLSRRRFLIGTTAFAGVVLAGCATPPPPEPAIPEIRFLSKPPFRLKAAVVDIVDEVPPAAPGPEWGNVFPTLPRTAMGNWARDRLVADPLAANMARFRITESAIQHTLGEKVKGVFKPDRREKFLIRVAADLEIRQPDGLVLRSVTGKSWGEESILVDEDPTARKKAIDGLVRRVMTEFDREMEAAIRANMADLLI